MITHEIVGVWKLIQYITTVEDTGKIISLFDGQALGLIIYTPDGYMSFHAMQSARVPCHSVEQEMFEIAQNYGGYCGKYKIEGEILIHYPEVSSVISYLGSAQKRKYHISGNRLYLEYSHTLNEYTSISQQSIKAHSKIIWEKL